MLADLEERADKSFGTELAAWSALVGQPPSAYFNAKPELQRLRAPRLTSADPAIAFMTSAAEVRRDGRGKSVDILRTPFASQSAVKPEYAAAHPISLDRPNPFHARGLLSSQLYQEIVAESFPSVLRPADRSSMAFGIEIRSPFLDHRLVEYALGLPASFSIRGGISKWLLRESMVSAMPERVRSRLDKQGMNVPSVTWLRGPWREPVRAVLASGSLADHGVLDQKMVLQRFDQHVSGSANHYLDIWHWYNLELWLRQH